MKFPLAILAACVAVVLTGTGVATAETARTSKTSPSNHPCWKDVLNDWVPDGRVDGTYRVRCYQQALKHLPPDVREYSNAEDAFKRALLAVAAKGNGGPPDPNALVVGAKGEQTATKRRMLQTHQPGFFRRVLDALGPSNAETIPTPLLVLAGIAALLLLAALASFVARWLQTRKLRPAPAPPPPKRP